MSRETTILLQETVEFMIPVVWWLFWGGLAAVVLMWLVYLICRVLSR